MPKDSTRPVWPFKHITKLSAHPRGVWCKKIEGKLKYFGNWRMPDPGDEWARAALRKYLAFAQAHQDNTTIPPVPGDVTLELVINHWLTDREEAVNKGELTARQFVLYKNLGEKVAEVLGKHRSIQSLGPPDMKKLRDSYTGGPMWVGSQVRWTRGMLNWGREYYGVTPRYGGMFSAPSKASVRISRRAFVGFTAAEIKKILKHATPAVRAFIYLGLNCGFGQTDCAKLQRAAVDLERREIHYPRTKTGVERRCPLWPETVKALREYQRPHPAHPDLFFVTRFGRPYVSEKRHENDAGQLERATRTDSVLQEFGLAQRLAAGGKSRYEVMKAGNGAAFKPKGFYILRHMFRSLAEETGKISAIRVIMGQAFPGMDDYYLHLKVGKYRDLRTVTDSLRGWLQKG